MTVHSEPFESGEGLPQRVRGPDNRTQRKRPTDGEETAAHAEFIYGSVGGKGGRGVRVTVNEIKHFFVLFCLYSNFKYKDYFESYNTVRF